MRLDRQTIGRGIAAAAMLCALPASAVEGMAALSAGINVHDQFDSILPTRSPVIPARYRFCRGEPFWLYLAVENPAVREGKAKIDGIFRLCAPDGSERLIGGDEEIYSGAYPGGQVISPLTLRTRMTGEDPVGDYRLLVTFVDCGDGSRVDKELKFRITGDYHDDGSTMSIADMELFLDGYYLAPDPSQILPAFRGFIAGEANLRMQKGREFSPYGYVTAFARLLELNPQLRGAFADAAAKLPADKSRYAALVIAGAGKKCVKAMMPLLDTRTAGILGSFGGRNPLEHAEVGEIAQIDGLWREFTVTGRVEPVRKMVAELEDRPTLDLEEVRQRGGRLTEEERGRLRNFLLRKAAAARLTAGAPGHRLLYCYLEAMLARGELPAGNARILIEKIVADSADVYPSGGRNHVELHR